MDRTLTCCSEATVLPYAAIGKTESVFRSAEELDAYGRHFAVCDSCRRVRDEIAATLKTDAERAKADSRFFTFTPAPPAAPSSDPRE